MNASSRSLLFFLPMLAALFHKRLGDILIRAFPVDLEPGTDTQKCIFKIPAITTVPTLINFRFFEIGAVQVAFHKTK